MAGNFGFGRGFTNGLPILFGYFAVGFTVAVAAIANGHPVWSPILQSLTHLSGTSQGAIVNGVSFTSGSMPLFSEVVLLCAALNLRYLLLSLAVAQKLSSEVTLMQRFLIAMGITDEIVAVAVSRDVKITFKYFMGLLVSSYLGWNLGTLLGAFGTTLLPADAMKPLGIALYAMFVAIVVPEVKRSKPICVSASIAALLNMLLLILPEGMRPKASLAMLISGVAGAVAGAVLYPIEEKDGRL